MNDDEPRIEPGESRVPTDNTVRGVFDERDAATAAVRRLAAKSVPADAIDVFALDAAGAPDRRIAVEDEAGTLRGAMIGAGIGAVIGLLIVIVVGAGLLGPTGVDPLGLGSLAGALRAIAMGAVAGVPLGALIGMGHWAGRKKIAPDEQRGGRLLIVVRTEDLEEISRSVLRECGASRVEVGEWRAPATAS